MRYRVARAVLGVVTGLFCAGPVLAQTAQDSAKPGPTDPTGHMAPPGTPVAPAPPPDATTAGSAAPGIPVPPQHATGGSPGAGPRGTPGSVLPAPDASTSQTSPAR